MGTKHLDGTEALDYMRDDGGRAAAGFKGSAGDCVARAVAIASGRPYSEVYAALANGTGTQRITKHTAARGATARSGINVRRQWFKDYMAAIGFTWHPTMFVGQGCKVHLLKGELPMGRLVVALSKHYTAVIDGEIHDTFDPTRSTLFYDIGNPTPRITHRCVYGYWRASQ